MPPAEPVPTAEGAAAPERSLWLAVPEDAEAIVEVIRAAFAARPPVDPPSTADRETAETVRETLRRGSGVTAWVGERLAGVILLVPRPDGVATLQRVSVHPDFQRLGLAGEMVAAAHRLAAELGCREVELLAREEFPALVDWWLRRGYRVVDHRDHGVILSRAVPVVLRVPTAEDMQQLGERLADVLQAGDLIIAEGPLGAGKTTLTQGIGRGLQVADPVISPTFVLSRVHRPLGGRPGLVHVDAYRLGSAEELDDLDLPSSGAGSVLLVEWGRGRAEQLSEHRLDVEVHRDDPTTDARTVVVTPVGERWAGVDLAAVLDPDRRAEQAGAAAVAR
ncbi:tRNA (adenosine(37)-N6)-threonylcarbamoyltransferase complex ATPase subunit type 1 TsaE [Auraticoccus sp. F435]|uniref:tRNA threonylcarbamoyladenosine biosynthesis protein TsaE n=1 Tax=Auraticoccus cholistanensis TaxID=2656650 RepID=A0A6A9UXH7_9ACTN|nr:tRNA (adenosine(37)-N6)-threonylcarbamoyltransferase complex ATPase subunit type 1 TsaE [Auraticoccus cholistanensis]